MSSIWSVCCFVLSSLGSLANSFLYIFQSGLSEYLDLDIPVSDLDNQRVIVIANPENAGKVFDNASPIICSLAVGLWFVSETRLFES